jgi:ligand-binding sensor domain-containing protein
MQIKDERMVRLFALVLISVSFSSCGQTQANSHKENIKSETKDSISLYGPTGMVRNVKQARNGDILIASYTGVWRYDGKLFTNITSQIPSPSFWDVLEDRKGNLWFGTRDSGFYRYDGKTFQHFTTEKGLAGNYGALHLYEDQAGNIWFGTVSGAYLCDGRSLRSFTTKDGLPNNDINTIMEDKTGKFWFGTRGDLSVYDGKTFTVLKNKDGKTFKNVWGIMEDKKGNIWFGADGLWRYDGRTFTKVSQKGAYAIIEDKKGNIWTTGADEPPRTGQAWSVSRYDAKSLYSERPTVTEIMSGTPAFLGLLEANDGSIWFGSMGGVYRYDGKSITDFKSK